LQVVELASGSSRQANRMHTPIFLKELTMKTLLVSLIGALTIGATLPAFAGPDWQAIGQARKSKMVRLQQSVANDPLSDTRSTSSSQQKESQHDKMMKECADMMQKSS
jgi:hypothetical protein